ncbi:hypothetical protein GAR06_02932 [Micromonospora saelicesensis]|nr:hypothetical protein GAR06_02932 [Micromonospora saelicesensis]
MELRPIGRAGCDGVEAQPRLGAGDGAVGVQVPLLVGLAVAVPDEDRRAVAAARPTGVQALVAVDGQGAVGGVGPALVGATVTVPQLRAGAVGGAGVGDVDAPPGLAPCDQHVLLAGRWGRRRGSGGRHVRAELGEEPPHLLLDPAPRAALTAGAPVHRTLLVPAVERGPEHRVAGLAGVRGGDVGQAAGPRLGRALRGASVVADEPVAQRPSAGDVVVDAVNPQVRHGLGAAAASADRPRGRDCRDRTEHRRPGTRQRVAHRAAVAEPDRETLGGVDAESVVDHTDHVVGEGDVLTVGVAPAVVEALRGDEDGAVVRLRLHAVVGPRGSVGAAARDLAGGAAQPVEPEGQPVGVGVVVVVRQPKDEAAALAAALDGVGAAVQSRRLAAAGSGGRRRRRDGREDVHSDGDQDQHRHGCPQPGGGESAKWHG